MRASEEIIERRRATGRHLVALLIVIAALATASASSGGPTRAGANELTLAVPANFPGFANVFVAKANGYFEDEDVNVKLVTNTGANTLTLLTSGQADLAMFGASAALILPARGISTSIIYGFLGGGEAGNIGVKSDASFPNIMALSGKRVGTQGIGSASWGWATVYNDYVKARGGKGFSRIALPNLPALLGSLQSGRVDAAVGAPSWFLSSQFKIFVNSSRPPAEVAALFKGGTLEAAIFGVTKTISSKPAAVVAFIKAVRRAELWLKASTNTQIATVLRGLPEFGTQDVSAIAATVAVERPYWAPTGGFVSPAMWQRSLKFYARWNIPDVRVRDPINVYAKRVKMAYWRAATR